MMEVVAQLGAFMAYALFGAVTRTLFGIYKSYTVSPKAKVKVLWKRVAIEIVASMFFGSFSAILLQEIGAFEYSQILAAIIAGFLGADLITLTLGTGIERRNCLFSPIPAWDEGSFQDG